jgi:hypothetical protein
MVAKWGVTNIIMVILFKHARLKNASLFIRTFKENVSMYTQSCKNVQTTKITLYTFFDPY